MTKPKYNLIQKVLSIICLCIACISTSTAQEVTLATNVDSGPRIRGEEELIEHNGKYYWYVRDIENDVSEYFIDFEFEEFDAPDFGGSNFGEQLRGSALIEYTPGEGLTDYIIFPYGDRAVDHLSFDGDSLLIWSDYHVFAVGDSLISGDLDSLLHYDSGVNGPNRHYNMSFAIYNFETHTIIDSYSYPFSYLDGGGGNPHRVENVALEGDFIYILSYWDYDYVLFGDSLDTFIPGDFYSPNTHISKLNLKTKKIEWSKFIGNTRYNGTYVRRVDQVTTDEDGNAIVLFISIDASQFEGVYLDDVDVRGPVDRVLYKVSPEGELLKHVRLAGPWDEPFRDHKLEIDGSINVFGITLGPQPIYVGKDTIIIEHQDKASLAIRLDKDWNLKWYQSYSGGSVVNAMNTSDDEESLILIPFAESLQLSDTVLHNPDTTPYPQFYPKVVLSFDRDGNRIGDPFLFSDKPRVHELITLEENKYLFFMRTVNVDEFEFLGDFYGFGPYEFVFNSFLEIEGDLFDVISTVDGLAENQSIVVYPSLIHQGEDINLLIPSDYKSSISKILIYDNTGILEKQQTIDQSIELATINTIGLSTGLKRVTFTINNTKITKSIIIN